MGGRRSADKGKRRGNGSHAIIELTRQRPPHQCDGRAQRPGFAGVAPRVAELQPFSRRAACLNSAVERAFWRFVAEPRAQAPMRACGRSHSPGRPTLLCFSPASGTLGVSALERGMGQSPGAAGNARAVRGWSNVYCSHCWHMACGSC